MKRKRCWRNQRWCNELHVHDERRGDNTWTKQWIGLSLPVRTNQWYWYTTKAVWLHLADMKQRWKRFFFLYWHLFSRTRSFSYLKFNIRSHEVVFRHHYDRRWFDVHPEGAVLCTNSSPHFITSDQRSCPNVLSLSIVYHIVFWGMYLQLVIYIGWQ